MSESKGASKKYKWQPISKSMIKSISQSIIKSDNKCINKCINKSKLPSIVHPTVKPKWLSLFPDPDVSLDDMVGQETCKQKVLEMVQQGKHAVLLLGPEGTGKKMFAQALATHLHRPLLLVTLPNPKKKKSKKSTSQLDQHLATRIKESFHFAKSQGPCILVFDQVEAYGRNCVNQLALHLDQVKNSGSIFVMGISHSDGDELDPLLRSPLCFPEAHLFSLPQARERQILLERHLQDVKLAKKVNLPWTASWLGCYDDISAKDIALFGQYVKKVEKVEKVSRQEFLQLVENYFISTNDDDGKAQQSSLQYKRSLAALQAGYCVVALHLHCLQQHQQQPLRVSIERLFSIDGKSLMVDMVPLDQDENGSQTWYESRLMSIYGGQIAQKMMTGQLWTFPNVKKPESILQVMYDHNLLPFLCPESGLDFHSIPGPLQQRLEKYCAQLYERASRILDQDKVFLQKVVDALVKRGTLYTDDFQALRKK